MYSYLATSTWVFIFSKFVEVRQKEFASMIPFSKQSYRIWT